MLSFLFARMHCVGMLDSYGESISNPAFFRGKGSCQTDAKKFLEKTNFSLDFFENLHIIKYAFRRSTA